MSTPTDEGWYWVRFDYYTIWEPCLVTDPTDDGLHIMNEGAGCGLKVDEPAIEWGPRITPPGGEEEDHDERTLTTEGERSEWLACRARYLDRAHDGSTGRVMRDASEYADEAIAEYRGRLPK